MPRLRDPWTGSTVSVSDDRAKGLLAQGYTAADEKKAPAKRAASSSKSSEK